MERFIASLDDEDIADRLAIAIDGRGAFRRFKDTLSRWPELMTRWHAFSESVSHFLVGLRVACVALLLRELARGRTLNLWPVCVVGGDRHHSARAEDHRDREA
jgi:hypothetical protein